MCRIDPKTLEGPHHLEDCPMFRTTHGIYGRVDCDCMTMNEFQQYACPEFYHYNRGPDQETSI